MRVAEQRSKRGSRPRGLFEGEHKQRSMRDTCSSPSSAAARVCEPRREPEGRRTWGRLLLLTFLGEARKVSSRRATPGIGRQRIDIGNFLQNLDSRLHGNDGAIVMPNPSTGAPPGPKMPEEPHQMAFYIIGCGENPYHVDTNRLCVDIDIKIPNPTIIVRMAVPP